MKKSERLIVGLLVLCAGIALILYRQYAHSHALKIHVYHHQTLIQTIDPSVNQRYSFQGDIGTFHLEVSDGRYRAIDVDCPNQICVHTGWVTLGDEKPIICAPNGLSVVQET